MTISEALCGKRIIYGPRNSAVAALVVDISIVKWPSYQIRESQ